MNSLVISASTPHFSGLPWQSNGACKEEDASTFFHPDGERGRNRLQRELRAKSICCNCPVLEQCREYSLTVEEPYGIWGGLSEAERKEILRNKPISHSC